MPSSKPTELTDEQREAIEGPLSRMDIAHFVSNYYGTEDFERHHGPLPEDLRSAWLSLETSVKAFESALERHKVRR